MDAEKREGRLGETLSSPVPRSARLGPGGLSARVAGVGDELLVLSLLERAASASGPTWDKDRAAWVVQSCLRDATRGLFVVAAGHHPVGLAAVSILLDPLRGWSGEVSLHWGASSDGSAEVRRWFLAEVFEFARYHGVNRLRLGPLPPEWETAAAEAIGASGSMGPPRVLEAVLRPHFDEGRFPA